MNRGRYSEDELYVQLVCGQAPGTVWMMEAGFANF